MQHKYILKMMKLSSANDSDITTPHRQMYRNRHCHEPRVPLPQTSWIGSASAVGSLERGRRRF